MNGRRVTIASYRVKVGDEIEVKEKSKQLALVLEATGLAERDVPDYIEVDHSKMTAKLTRIPRSPRCPTRCRWSRTSWSSSIRADGDSVVPHTESAVTPRSRLVQPPSSRRRLRSRGCGPADRARR